MAAPNPPKLDKARTRRSYTSTRRTAARPCELCYRPLIDTEATLCASCTPKAQRLRPTSAAP